METVHKYVNVASNAASTALWGENQSPQAQQATAQHGDEPISGVQGKGVVTDPYDAGNREDQPGAIATEDNTAIQTPIIGGKQETPKEGTFTTHPDPSTGVKTTENVDTAFATPSAASTSASTAHAQPSSSSESTGNGDNNDASAKEQRSTSQSQENESKEGENNVGPRPTHARGVSKEALEGPQGPAPRPAEEFEDESKGKKGAKMDKIVEKTSSSESKDSEKSNASPRSDKSGNSSQGSEKQGAMSKVKESVKKHLHH